MLKLIWLPIQIRYYEVVLALTKWMANKNEEYWDRWMPVVDTITEPPLSPAVIRRALRGYLKDVILRGKVAWLVHHWVHTWPVLLLGLSAWILYTAIAGQM